MTPRPPHLPGHLSHGWLNHHVMREHVCACGAKFTGPPVSRRCLECRIKIRKPGLHAKKVALAAERNAKILESRAAGATYPQLAKEFGLSTVSIWMILKKANQ